MSFSSVFHILERNFLSWGWLAPAFFPFLEAIGRGPLNTSIGVYTAWGLLVLARRGFSGDRKTVILYFVLIAVFGLSVIGAEDVYRGARTWGKFSFVVLTYFVTLHALALDKNSYKRQFKCLAWVGVLTVVVLLIRGGITSDWRHLVPVRGMFERNLPFLMVFLLFCLRYISHVLWRRSLMLLSCCAFFLVIIFSGGRSAFVAFIVSIILYGLLVTRFRIRTVLAGVVILVTVTGLLAGPLITRGIESYNEMSIDTLSSNRAKLWRQAITHPPENIWFGVGMGNVRYVEEVVRTSKRIKVKHLHNIIMDCWYDTGIVGLLFWLLFISSILLRPIKNWHLIAVEYKKFVAVTFSAVMAIFMGGLLSFSYYSPQMTCYLFFIMATLYHLSDEGTLQTHCQSLAQG